MTHQSAGRQVYTPAMIPSEYADAAHNMGCRGALPRKVGGAGGAEGGIIRL